MGHGGSWRKIEIHGSRWFMCHGVSVGHGGSWVDGCRLWLVSQWFVGLVGLCYGSSSWFGMGFLFDFGGLASVDFVIFGCFDFVILVCSTWIFVVI